MSGTSIDGADVILADFSNAILRVIDFHSEDFSPPLRAELLALNVASEKLCNGTRVYISQRVGGELAALDFVLTRDI